MHPLLHLLLLSGWNRVLVGVRRLREPKYLFGLLATVAYFWIFVFGPLSRGDGPAADLNGLFEKHGSVLESVGALLLFLALAASWLLPNKRAALRFTETEVNVLFPAPVDRTTLVHFKLAKLQAGTLLSVVLLSIVFGLVRPGGPRIELAVAWWLIFTLLQLHGLGAAFARERMLDRGVPGWKRRAAVGSVLAAALVATLAWIWAGTGEAGWGKGPLGFLGLIRDGLQNGPLGILLEPFRHLVRPMFSLRGLEFVVAVLPLAAVTALHYFWVLRSCVAFEEASVELSEKSAQRVADIVSRANRGLPLNLKARPDAWRLKPVPGRAEMALAWKNLTLLGPWGTFRRVPIVIGACALVGWAIGAFAPVFVDIMSGSIALTLFAFTLFSGGQLLRFDLRQDVHHLDVLKTLPLTGAQMVRGELFAPVWTLLSWQTALLAFTLPILLSNEGGRDALIGSGWWVAFPLVLLIAPLLNALNFLLANALFLLFPAWYQVDAQNAQGLSRMGQGLIQMLFQSVLMMVVLVPATAILFAFAFAAIRLTGTPFGALIAVIPCAALLAAAVVFFTDAVGRDFEEFDIAKELR